MNTLVSTKAATSSQIRCAHTLAEGQSQPNKAAVAASQASTVPPNSTYLIRIVYGIRIQLQVVKGAA